MTDPHAEGGPAIAGDVSSFPHDAEYARTLVAAQRRGHLATLTADGFPFGSVVSYVDDAVGRPVVCISAMAEHTINAKRDPRASLLVATHVPDGDDPLAAARVTLVGTLVPFDVTSGPISASSTSPPTRVPRSTSTSRTSRGGTSSPRPCATSAASGT